MALNTCEMYFNGIKMAVFSKKLSKNRPTAGGFAPRPPSVLRLRYTTFLNTSPKLFALFNNYLKLSPFAKSCLNANKQRFQIFHPMISLSHKSSSFENFWWCHCVWFVVWASLPIKNSGHAYKLEIAWKKFLKIFFLENTCGCSLGSWPRAFLSLASRGSVLEKAVHGLGLGFFLCPWPWPPALCPRFHHSEVA